MKKMFFFWVFILVVFLFEVKTSLAGVSVYFDFQEGQVSSAYVKFTHEFGSEFVLRVKQYEFRREYSVYVLEGIGKIGYENRIEEEEVIVVLINEEKIPFVWIKVKDLSTEGKIRKKAKEFSHEIFEKLKILERLKTLERKKKIN